jgi:hypothetical protein
MITKASGRTALLLAAGLWVCYTCFVGSSQAVAGSDDAAAGTTPAAASAAPVAPGKSAKHNSHPKSAHRKSDDVAQKSSGRTAAADSAPSMPPSSALPPSIANANAQISAADTLAAGNARAMSERANNMVQAAPDASSTADVPIVTADQLNDVDRTLRENPAPATPPTMASANAPVMAASSPLMATGNGNTTWDRTSLIGKIFIGFGVLLTMASAVRMFIA